MDNHSIAIFIMIVESLIKIILEQDVKLKEDKKKEVIQQINNAFYDRTFRFLVKEGRTIGFFTWFKKYREDGIHIFINNMCILKEYKNKNNLLHLRKILMKDIYPNAVCFSWYNRKKNKSIIIK